MKASRPGRPVAGGVDGFGTKAKRPVTSNAGDSAGYVSPGASSMKNMDPTDPAMRTQMGMPPGRKKGVAMQHADMVGMTPEKHKAMAATHRGIAKGADHMTAAHHLNMAQAHEAAANVPVVKNKPKTAAFEAGRLPHGAKRRVGTPL